MALISSIYKRGDESAAHYKRSKGTRSSNWANVPKNNRQCNKERTTTIINVHQHSYEVKHGYGALVTCLEDLFK